VGHGGGYVHVRRTVQNHDQPNGVMIESYHRADRRRQPAGGWSDEDPDTEPALSQCERVDPDSILHCMEAHSDELIA